MAAAERDWTLLPDDITRDIFARLRPSDPLYLFRVSYLCKVWRRALTDPHFLHLLHERHVAPLPLGFLHDERDAPTFVRTINWPFSPADVPERRHWKVLDCRHGRALFLSMAVAEHGGFDLLVWDPISGDRRRVPVPPEASRGEYPGAALVCAAPGCNHRPTCNGGHFQVAFVANPPLLFDVDDPDVEEMVTRGFIYSSEMDSWIEVNSIPDLSEAFGRRTSVLVGHSVYLMSDDLIILKFDLAGSTLSVIPSPDIGDSPDEDRIILMVTEDGGLGVAEALDGFLYLWSREITAGNVGTWEKTRSLDPCDLCLSASGFDLIGFAEGANTIFMKLSDGGIFTFELSSEQGRTVLKDAEDFYCVFPVVSFYATHNVLQGPGGVQHNLPNANVDDGDEGIVGEEKALELAQQQFNTGSNYIEQMDVVNTVHCLRQSL
uniref:Uncharacterized protein n=1 Tax=Avena sativa TaxID=4498 RepID=A0ACD5VDA2_AVESA